MTRALLFLLGLTSAAAATAPDSIAGKIYRETAAIVATRSSWETTIFFRHDGRFVSVKHARGTPLDRANPWKVFLRPPRPDGSYAYRRTGDASGTVELMFDDGTSETLTLDFTTPTGGETSNGIIIFQSFSLSEFAAAEAAPATNLSTRGRVEAGRPLIVGFVVPGPPDSLPPTSVPPAGAIRREMLIRVVGPSLAPFGVQGAWADPNFELFRGDVPAPVNQIRYGHWSSVPLSNASGEVVDGPPNADLQAAFRKIFNAPGVGAFPLLPDSKDAAAVFRLPPGAYTIVAAAAAGDPGGEVLIEVYFLP